MILNDLGSMLLILKVYNIVNNSAASNKNPSL